MRLSVSVMLFLLPLIAMSAGCSSSSSDPEPGADGDWEAADLLDSDDSDVMDGDTDITADRDETGTDLTDSEGDDDDTVEENEQEEDMSDSDDGSGDDEADGDVDDNADMEPEPEIEYEEEAEYEFMECRQTLTIEDFPPDNMQIIPCEGIELGDINPLKNNVFALWPDGAGTVFFKTGYGVFRYTNAPEPKAECINGLPGYITSMSGRMIGNDIDLWCGSRDQIFRYYQNVITTEPLPEPAGSGQVWQMAVTDTFIAAQTSNGILLRDAEGTWEPVDWCEGAEFLSIYSNPRVIPNPQQVMTKTGLVWHNGLLYAGDASAVWEIDPVARQCRPLCSRIVQDGYHTVNGLATAGVWAVRGKECVSVGGICEAEIGVCGYDGQWTPDHRIPPDWRLFAGHGKGDKWVGGYGTIATWGAPVGLLSCQQEDYLAEGPEGFGCAPYHIETYSDASTFYCSAALNGRSYITFDASGGWSSMGTTRFTWSE